MARGSGSKQQQAHAANRVRPPSRLDELLDEALKDTFPASDPVAVGIDRPTKTQREIRTPEAPLPGSSMGLMRNDGT